LPSDPRPGFGRHDPSTWIRTLAYRRRTELPYDVAAYPAASTLVLDTTVYIDALKPGGLPMDIAARVATAPIQHSAVAVAELAANLGLLDPRHPNTAAVRGAIEDTLSRLPADRIVPPSVDTWSEAAVIAGTLARTQGLPPQDRRKLLNDALIFLSAGNSDAVLVSRNARDIDLLLRFRPEVRVLLYDQERRAR